MPDLNLGNRVVEQLNEIATEIMNSHNITLVNLYKDVTDHCGKIYEDCDICALSPCTYHYNS